MAEAWIIDACRTPRSVGTGALAEMHPRQLGPKVLAAIAKRNDLETGDVDDIIWSTSVQSSTNGGYLGPTAALDAGYSSTASGGALDRFCGSGITGTSSDRRFGMLRCSRGASLL